MDLMMPDCAIDAMCAQITDAFTITLSDLKELLPAIVQHGPPEEKKEFIEKLCEDKETMKIGLDLPKEDKFSKEKATELLKNNIFAENQIYTEGDVEKVMQLSKEEVTSDELIDLGLLTVREGCKSKK